MKNKNVIDLEERNINILAKTPNGVERRKRAVRRFIMASAMRQILLNGMNGA